MKRPPKPLTTYQRIFLLSKAQSGTENHQDNLPRNYWPWPRNTFLATRLRVLRRAGRRD